MRNWPINTGQDGTAVNVTSVSQTIDISSGGTDLRMMENEDVMIDNPGPNDVYVRGADTAAGVATVLSLRVPAASLQPYRKGTSRYLALVCAAGKTQTVVVHVGEGQ
ncbi:MAG: hypothetical protein AzoDbin1_05112 [Azoarcus sp.]|nr:hypothetical protein [Azoarcus sp.]